MTKLIPIGNNVIVKQREKDEKSAGGILLVSKDDNKPDVGEVLAVGPGKVDHGVLVKVDVSEGDLIAFKKYSGTVVKVDDQEFLVVNGDSILAIIE